MASLSARLFFAKTTVSGNASATVVFANPKPVINSFTNVYDGYYPNFLMQVPEGESTYDNLSVFYWSVVNATRYELYAPSGVIYSGTASSFRLPAGIRVVYGYATRMNFTLRAWNGSTFTDYTINLETPSQSGGCDANCSGS